MSLIELGPGQHARLPRVPIRVSLTSTTRTPAQVEALGAPGSSQRISGHEIVVLPKAGQVQLSVSPAAGGAFAPGDLVGLSLRTEGGPAPEQVEISQSSVESMTSARLAVLEVAGDISVTASGPQRAPEWLASGINSLRRCGVSEHDRAVPTPWALVVDGSASMLALQSSVGEDGRGTLEAMLRLVAGVLYGFTNRLPDLALRTAAGGDADLTQVLAAAEPEVEAVLAPAPAPWSRLGPSVMAAQAVAPLVVVLTDGVPVDVADLAAGLRWAKGELVVLTLAADPSSGLALPADLEPLSAITEQANGHVAWLPALAGPDGPRVDLSERATAALAATIVRARSGGSGW